MNFDELDQTDETEDEGFDAIALIRNAIHQGRGPIRDDSEVATAIRRARAR